jgi:virginiamycin A acetyltransferase
VKALAKAIANLVFLLLAFPLALLSGFGRIRPIYTIGAHLAALGPGILGDYFRAAFYRLTLAECPLSVRISFGTFFAHPEARLASGVYIGSFCVLGKVTIGERTQIASGVQILSGARQHSRDLSGRIEGAESGEFQHVVIGSDCWIGAAAIVMAGVGEGSTVGSGTVVTKPVPAGVVVAGNPAKVINGAVGGASEQSQATPQTAAHL